ncbi:MAG TPA: PC4/YdbC family ssDNA-binding protein [Rectinemataceae bacterium]|nr:PC4/YdbC family ssDNA-binding protein [Rectinemataceae bacterium]
MDDKEFKFEVTRQIGLLGESAKGWRKELNLVSWNEREPKLDIREWSPDHQKMGKGVTFSREEAVKLAELLKTYLAT